MITFRKIDKKSKDCKEVKRIIREAFPAKERPPFGFMLRRAKKDWIDFIGIYDKEKLIGTAYIITAKGIAYLFLFAMKKEERGNGYGRQAMELMKEKYKDSGFFLALEQLDQKAANYEQRKKRHSFYESCGLQDRPFYLKEASMIYDVMGIGRQISPEEYKKMMDNYLGQFLKRFVDTRFLEKPEDSK